MSHTTNSLVEIPRSEWPKLRDLYGAFRTASSSFNMLQIFINWIQKNPKLNVTIYSLNGDWANDGTFIAKEDTTFYCNTLAENQNRLIAALNCLEEKSNYLIGGFPLRLRPAIEQHFIDSGLSSDTCKPDGTFWYHIPREEVEKFEVDAPTDIKLATLESQHAEQINQIWPHRAPGSVEFVRRLIRYNVSVGAFDEAGQLMAWCLQLPIGSLGVLQVEEQHKRKGLGNLLVRSMAKQLLANNFEVLAPVVFTNVASRSMFEKLGAVIVDQVFWTIKPVKKQLKGA